MTGARTGRGAVLYGAAPASWWVGVVAGRVVVEVDRGGAVPRWGRRAVSAVTAQSGAATAPVRARRAGHPRREAREASMGWGCSASSGWGSAADGAAGGRATTSGWRSDGGAGRLAELDVCEAPGRGGASATAVGALRWGVRQMPVASKLGCWSCSSSKRKLSGSERPRPPTQLIAAPSAQAVLLKRLAGRDVGVLIDKRDRASPAWSSGRAARTGLGGCVRTPWRARARGTG